MYKGGQEYKGEETYLTTPNPMQTTNTRRRASVFLLANKIFANTIRPDVTVEELVT